MQSKTIYDLPQRIVSRILGKLDLESLYNIGQTDTHLSDLANDVIEGKFKRENNELSLCNNKYQTLIYTG